MTEKEMKNRARLYTGAFFLVAIFVLNFFFGVEKTEDPGADNRDVTVGATTYYISNYGSDSNAGTSSSTAWASIDKIEASSFAVGDTIQFRCGDEWRFTGNLTPPTSGSSGNPITFTNYGNCADADENLPLLMGSWDYGSSTSFWIDTGGNEWVNATGTIASTPGHLFAWDGENYGADEVTPLTREATVGGLDAQGDYWYDSTNDLLRIYSTSNPATAYNHLEVPLNGTSNIIYNGGGSRSYITLDGLALLFSAQHCITISGTGSNWIVQNSELAWCGSVPYAGNGIDWHGSANNSTFTNNEVWQPHDSCVSPQNFNPGDEIHDLTITNNNLHDCSTGFELLNYTPQGGDHDNTIIRDITFQDNTIDCNGGSYALTFNQVGDNGIQALVWGRGTTTGITIKGNTIKNCVSNGVQTSNGNGIRILSNGDSVYSTDNTNWTIEGNKIFDNEYNGISFECSGCGNEYNTTSALVINNFIYNNGAEEIEFVNDDRWQGVRFHNNTFVDNTGDADELFDGNANNTIVMYNNIFHANTQAITNHSGTFTADYNLYYATNGPANLFASWEGTARADLAAVVAASNDEDNGVESDPLFEAVATFDFDITSGSPAENAALDSEHLVSTDFYGNAKVGASWDIGAHELQAAGGATPIDGVRIIGGQNIQAGMTIR